MPWQDVQQICLNGHQITDTFKYNPLSRKDFCTTCGAKTITNCINCGKEIPGETHYENVIDLSGVRKIVPKICQYCGNKFPWANTLDSKEEVKEKLSPTHKLKNRNKLKIGAVITGITGIFIMIINGSQVWSIFRPKAEKESAPIINISAPPIRINFSDISKSDKQFLLSSKVEIGTGTYKFVDSVTIDTFKIIDSSYFVLDISNPKMDVIKTVFNKMILGDNVKEQEIKLQLKGDYILRGKKVVELYELKSDKLIANIQLNFPYYFEGRKYNQKVEVPIFTYYDSSNEKSF